MTDSVTTNTEQTRLTGRVKWFNNQAGYGFLTATVDDNEQDIFVHHSALKTNEDQFRYVVEGEYVSFVTSTNSDDKTTATDVTGAGGGKLMCETRWERKQANNSRSKSQDDGSDSGSRPRRNNRERFHGGGPRQGDRVKVVEDEDGNSTVWKLVRSGKGAGGSRGKGSGRGRGRRQNRDSQEN